MSEEDVSPLDDENSLYSHPNKTASWLGENVENQNFLAIMRDQEMWTFKTTKGFL